MTGSSEVTRDTARSARINLTAGQFPWWFVGMLLIIGGMAWLVATNENYREAFEAVFPWPLIEQVETETGVETQLVVFRGIGLTLLLTVGSFAASLPLGLVLALGRLAGRNPARTFIGRFVQTAVNNLATLYIELVRGIPMIVFIFTIAFVFAPDFADLVGLESRAVTNAWRGAAALSLFYAAFIAEVIRGGIQSVERGQLEAGRALGLGEFKVMRKIVLPQALRNMLPALGNDLIALMKDTSLVSVLAVRELTQMVRLYTGSSFRFREGFFVLVVVYVTLTLILSLTLRWYEKHIEIPSN